MNTMKLALAAALVVTAGTVSFAGGLDGHDPQSVGNQSLTNMYVVPVDQASASGAGGTDAFQTPANDARGLTDAERVNVMHNDLKDYNK